MHILKNKWTLVVALIGLLTLSGMAIASAAEGEADTTVFNYGADDSFLFWNVTSLEGQDVDQEALDEALADEEALVDECTLKGEVYSYTINGDDLTLELEDSEGAGSAEETSAIECHEVVFVDVTGEAGQVSHGMFLEAFNETYDALSDIYDLPNRGCLIRHIAGSSFGMGPDHVTAADAEEADPEEITGQVEFETLVTACERGDDEEESENDDSENDEDGEGGPPSWVEDLKESRGPPDWVDAPGLER